MPRKLTLITLLAFAALAAPAQASKSQFTIFEAPRELGSGDAGLAARTLDEIKATGAEYVRVVLYWKNVAPSAASRRRPDFKERDPSAYDWSRYDSVVTQARERGLKVFLTISGPVPKWATGNRKGYTYKPRAKHFARFAEAVGRRYGDSVDDWSVWNEPNHPQFLRPQFARGRAVSPRIYRGLWRAGVRGLRASGNGGDRMLAGETAPRGTPRVVAPIKFIEKFYCGRCGTMAVDGWAHHPYTTKAGPKFRPPNRNDVTIGALSRLTRALDRETRNGLGLYLTEFGIQSEPDPYVGVSERKQAEFRSIAERIAYNNGRVRAFSQYMLRDDAPREGSRYARYSGFESGLRHSSGEAKLSYDAFRLPLVADRGSSRVTLWGLVRPATGATTVTVQSRDRGRGWRTLKTKQTDGRGYWRTTSRFRKGRSYRVIWGDLVGPRTRVYR